jgi:hypothetical protein
MLPSHSGRLRCIALCCRHGSCTVPAGAPCGSPTSPCTCARRALLVSRHTPARRVSHARLYMRHLLALPVSSPAALFASARCVESMRQWQGRDSSVHGLRGSTPPSHPSACMRWPLRCQPRGLYMHIPPPEAVKLPGAGCGLWCACGLRCVCGLLCACGLHMRRKHLRCSCCAADQLTTRRMHAGVPASWPDVPGV